MQHKILDVLEDELLDNFVYKTTHDKITYDETVESFIVDLGDGSWCEVYGRNRFDKAIQIANLIHREELDNE